MSVDPNELCYPGYDPDWILGRQTQTHGYESSSSSSSSSTDDEDTSDVRIIKLKMPLCCDGCVMKVYKKLKAMDGVASVECDVKQQKVTVRGIATTTAVLKKAKKILPRSDLWVEEESENEASEDEDSE